MKTKLWKPSVSVTKHDVSPAQEKAIKDKRLELEDLGVDKLNILIVPNWHGQYDLRKHNKFVDWLLERYEKGDELLLHGCYHESHKRKGHYLSVVDHIMGEWIAGGQAEFQNFTYDEAARIINISKKILKEAGLLEKITGFVPPWWQIREEAIKAVKEAGFDFVISATPAEIFLKQQVPIRWFKTGKIDRSYEISSEPKKPLSYFTRGYGRFAEIKYQNSELIRVAYHPPDDFNEDLAGFQDSLVKRLLSKRKLVTYSRKKINHFSVT